ncbi:MAG: hypothetical protein P4L53_24780 [Candidatus Obscuribacterales bacterium]|nr:hypothetical protein [Candidatus Obscuribacterales bacterium]
MFLQSKNGLRERVEVFVIGSILLGAFVLFSPLDSLFNSHFILGALAESEASSEAAGEAPMTGGRRGRGYWRSQMQQQRMAAQQARRQQQMQSQQQRKQNLGGAQRNKAFKVSDYIHEYGSGRSKGKFNRGSLSGANSSSSPGLSPSAGQTSGGSSLGNTPATSSVPFQKFPPK